MISIKKGNINRHKGKPKPIFMIVECQPCDCLVVIEEGDNLIPHETKKNTGYVSCPSCQCKVEFRLAFSWK